MFNGGYEKRNHSNKAVSSSVLNIGGNFVQLAGQQQQSANATVASQAGTGVSSTVTASTAATNSTAANAQIQQINVPQAVGVNGSNIVMVNNRFDPCCGHCHYMTIP